MVPHHLSIEIIAQIKNVTLEVLKIIRETKNDDLTNTLQKIIGVYRNELAPLAVDMCQNLVSMEYFCVVFGCAS